MSSELGFSLAAVILAAGQSLRMGRPKMLLPWGKSSVIGHVVGQWTPLAPGRTIVVYAAGDTGIENELNRIRFPMENRVLNPDPARGMFSSVQCAAQWQGWHPMLTHWAIALGDQPHLRPLTLHALAAFAKQEPEKICQPSRSGHPRHPVLFPKFAFEMLADSRSQTLKEFLQAQVANVKSVELDDPGLELDLDHPSDYQSALEHFRPQ